ncbi:immunoglobulin domain-containing protein [Nibricoccus sp. IMCC34717]|uniref:immunoglobulin domain-containing protein n=1 Tax=Nibricoccus sp. IMCC34717 TaxID=3034021 RepID=UPI00384E7AFE
MLRLFIAILFFLGLAAGCVPQAVALDYPSYGGWTSGRIRGGGYLQNVVFAPSKPGRLYAYVDVAGAYRSDNGGRMWRMINSGLPAISGVLSCRTLDVDPRNEDVLLYAAGEQWSQNTIGLFRSQDGGETWSKVLVAQFYGNEDFRWAGTIIARDPASPDTVLVGTAGTGLWRSTDNGLTWAKSPGLDGVNPTDLKFDPSTPGRAWLSAQTLVPFNKPQLNGGFWRSDDGGLSWTRTIPSGPSEVVLKEGKLYGIFVTYVNSRPQGKAVKVSTDGVTWTDFGTGLPLSGTSEFDNVVEAIAVAGDRLVVGTAAGEFYTRKPTDSTWMKVVRASVDKGDWWGTVPADGGWYRYGKATASIVVDPADVNHWWFSDWYAGWESTNAGRDWTLRIEGLETTVIHCVVQDPANPKRVYLGMGDNGYFRSEDGGATWFWPDAFNNAKSIVTSPANPTRVYGVGTKSGEWRADGIFLSTDSGKTWQKSPMTGLPVSNFYNSIDVDPTRDKIVYVGARGDNVAGGGVYRSTDGGSTWSAFSTGISNPDTFFVWNIWETGRQLAVGADGSLIAINVSGTMYRRGAGADAWTSVSAGTGALVSVVGDRLEAGRFFAVGGGGVFRSTDSGATWTKVLARAATRIETDAVVADRVVVGTSDGVYLSRDAGATWEALDPLLPSRIGNPVCFAGERVIAGSPGNGAFWISIANSPPQILRDPLSQSAKQGGNVSFSVAVSGATQLQWRKDGNDLPGETSATLELTGVTAADAGRYSLLATNANGSVASQEAELRIGTLDTDGALYSLSVRSVAGSDAETLIAGFVVAGARDIPILVRASGPALAPFGVSETLVNPGILLHRHDPDFDAASSANWSDGGVAQFMTALFDKVGAFRFPEGSLDAAVAAHVAPGRFSAVVNSNGGRGIALVELYDISGDRLADSPSFKGISARSKVEAGGGALIAGFSIRGSSSLRLLVRASGPALEQFHVSGVLADPMLELYAASNGEKLVSNNDWHTDNGAEIASVAAAAGAFAFPPGSKDSALLYDLPPGGYTALCRGADGGTGVALIEVYVVSS